MQNCTEPNERWVDEGETATAASVWKVKKKVKDFTSCTRKLFYVLTFFVRFRSFFPQVNVTRSSVYPSELRFRREYVLWYKNVFEFLAKGESNSDIPKRRRERLSYPRPPRAGLIPLALLIYLNYQVFAVIRRRRNIEHRRGSRSKFVP